MSRAIRSDTLNLNVWPSDWRGNWGNSNEGKLYDLFASKEGQMMLRSMSNDGNAHMTQNRINTFTSYIRNQVINMTEYRHYVTNISQAFFHVKYEDICENYLDDALKNLNKEFQKATKGFTTDQMLMRPSYAYDQKTGQRLSGMIRHDDKVEKTFQKFATEYTDILNKAASMFALSYVKANIGQLQHNSLDGLSDLINYENQYYRRNTFFTGMGHSGYGVLPTEAKNWFLSLIKNPKAFWETYDSLTLYQAALFFAAFTEVRKNNPQIKTYAVTNISAYQQRVYFFSEDYKLCRKKNTTFYAIDNFIDVPMNAIKKLNNAYVPEALKKYEEIAKKTGEEQSKQIAEAKEFVKNVPTIYAEYWKKMIQHFYSSQDLDTIGVAYATLLWGREGIQTGSRGIDEETQKLYAKVINYMSDNPVNHPNVPKSVKLYFGSNYYGLQAHVSYTFERGYPYDEGLETNFTTQTIEKIMEMGVPQYLYAPLREKYTEIHDFTNQNFNNQLQGYARQIMQVENNRQATLDSLREAWAKCQNWV